MGMTEPEKIFHQVIKAIPNGIEGKMFGAKCIKSIKGKTAAFFWKENMVFKLDEQTQEQALRLKEAKVGSHLYAPDRPMKGWVLITAMHSDKWSEFTEKALKYVEGLKK